MKITRSITLLILSVAMLIATGIPAAAAPSGINTTGQKSSRILILYFTPGENGGIDAVSSASITKRKGRNVGMVRALAEMIQ